VELFVPILGCKNIYEVSNYGNIKSLERKRVTLGYFCNPEEAVEAYQKALKEIE
jgi:hypothetical protein